MHEMLMNQYKSPKLGCGSNTLGVRD